MNDAELLENISVINNSLVLLAKLNQQEPSLKVYESMLNTMEDINKRCRNVQAWADTYALLKKVSCA